MAHWLTPQSIVRRYTRLVERVFGDDAASTRNLIVFVVAYFLLESITASLGKTGGDTDTTEIILYTQYWDWGYGGSQPPLPAWFSKAITDLFGLTLLNLYIAKFAILAVVFVAVAIAARRLALGPMVGAAATLGLFIIPDIGWEAQRSLAHTPGMLAFSGLGVVALIEIRRSGRVWTYLLFGVAWAAATLCRYNGMLFFLALVLAAAALPSWRRVVVTWRIGISVLACALLLAPHAIWAVDHLGAVTQRAQKFGIGKSGSALFDRLLGLGSLANVYFNLLVELVIVAGVTLVVYPSLRRLAAMPRGTDPDSLPAAVLAASFLVALATVLVSGAIAVQNAYLLSAVFLAPMAIAVAAWRAGTSDSAARPAAHQLNLNLAAIGLACALVAAVALPLHTVYASHGRPHPFKLDYRRFLAELDEQAGVPVGSIVASNYRIFANLRLVRPELRVINPLLPAAADQLTGPIVVILGGSGPPADFLSRFGVPADKLTRHATRLVRVDRPDIGLDVDYALVPARSEENGP